MDYFANDITEEGKRWKRLQTDLGRWLNEF
jgi:hypothetical protein